MPRGGRQLRDEPGTSEDPGTREDTTVGMLSRSRELVCRANAFRDQEDRHTKARGRVAKAGRIGGISRRTDEKGALTTVPFIAGGDAPRVGN